MKIAVDAMGGDNAPKAVIEGVMKAVEDFEDLEITLIGDRKKSTPFNRTRADHRQTRGRSHRSDRRASQSRQKKEEFIDGSDGRRSRRRQG